MGIEQIIFLVVGIISVIAGFTGLVTKTRKGKRWSNLIGETGVKALNVVIGIILIVLAFFI